MKTIPVPTETKRLLFLGDSITYQGQYVADVETGVILHAAGQAFTFINCGLPSETVSGLSEPNHAGGTFPRPHLRERLDRVLTQIKPDLVFACYGMNDAIYLPSDEARLRAFQDGQRFLHEAVIATGAKIFHLTSPVYDDVNGAHPYYSEVLATQAAWLLSRREDGWEVIDIFGPMKDYLDQQKNSDPDFKLAADGVHPGRLGHWLIAREILAALGYTQDHRLADGEALTATHPQGVAIRQLVVEREEMLRDAWLTATGHKRPEITPGLPLDLAGKKARKIHQSIQSLVVHFSQWNGFQRQEFYGDGRVATLVAPENALPGNPWIWRTEFFDAFPSVDIALLGEGFHLGYVKMENLYGGPAAMAVMDGFYRTIVKANKLSLRPVLEGFSRGGLCALNWAARNPSKVGALYLDAPVCDFKSWPAGKGKGQNSPGDWKNCLAVYGLSELEALQYPLNPVDNLESIAEAKIPIIAVAGDGDEVVPMEENILLVEKRYRELGGQIQLITKPGCGHHPHSLVDPTPVVRFLLQNAIRNS